MMTISDIIEIIVVCALIFFPLGYLARHSLRRIRDTLLIRHEINEGGSVR